MLLILLRLHSQTDNGQKKRSAVPFFEVNTLKAPSLHAHEAGKLQIQIRQGVPFGFKKRVTWGSSCRLRWRWSARPLWVRDVPVNIFDQLKGSILRAQDSLLARVALFTIPSGHKIKDN
jgi:hypothetical protein